jgi:ribosomal protein S21
MAENKPASKQYIEIADKNNKIKVEVNALFDAALKQLKKSPETLKGLREQIDEIIKSETDRKNENKPQIGEYFKDTFGRSFIVVGKNDLSEDKSFTLRRGNVLYNVKITDAYEKDGTKKNIEEKTLEENCIEVLF